MDNPAKLADPYYGEFGLAVQASHQEIKSQTKEAPV